MSGAVWIVGVGRPRYGDDEAGLVAARAASTRLGERVHAAEETQSGAVLLDAMDAAALLVIADAAHGDSFPPGAWRRLTLPDSMNALGSLNLCSTHTFSVPSLLRVGWAIRREPSAVWVYAIAGHAFAPETDPCPEVLNAARDAGEHIADDITAWLSTRP